jgi:hypothetical protein
LRWTRWRCTRERSQGGESRERSIPRRTSDVVAYGKTVWSWRPWLASSFAEAKGARPGRPSPPICEATEAKRIRLRGERGISRQTIAQGRPDALRWTCMLVCALLCANCTRDRGCSAHPVFPAPSRFRRVERPGATRAHRAARWRWHICRSPPDTILPDNHPDLSPVATVSPDGIFPRLPRGQGQARKLSGRRNANGARFDHQGQSLHCRDLRASHPARTR